VVLADAETVQQQARDKYMGDTICRQIADADIILLNKADLVTEEGLKATRLWLAARNRQARIVQTAQSMVPPETVLESFLGRSHGTGPHHEAANLDMLTLRPTGPVEVDHIAQALATDQGIIRAKGFATLPDGEKRLLQVVGQRWQTSSASRDKSDGIVCLGFKGQLKREALLKLLN